MTRSLLLSVAAEVLFFFACVVAASAENPLEWQFRLSGGPTSLSGRVEMRPNSTAPWGTICKDLFKENNFGPIAACNSVGLVGVTQALYKTTFGPGTGPIYLTNVACTASDTFIQNCSRSALLQVGACVHFEDVGVECSPPITLWQFKMVNGTAPSNGIVLMQPMPGLPWGSVNNFNFLYNGWVFNREVLCRTMGFNTTRATSGESRLLGALNDVTSVPSYLSINACPNGQLAHIGHCNYQQIGSSPWTGWNNLVLDCDPPAPARIGPSIVVRLVNGVTASSGFIWINMNAANTSQVPWVGITAEDVTGNQHASPSLVQFLSPTQRSLLRAVCTAAGFPNATNPIFGRYGATTGPPADVNGFARLVGMGFNCSDAPGTSLGDCTVGPDRWTGYSRYTGYYAGVDCFPSALNFTAWEYRLVGGTGPSNATLGRVELRPNSTAPWLGVCANNEFRERGVLWTALCRTMGFNTNVGMRSQTLAIPGLGSPMYYLGFSQTPSCPTVANNGLDLVPNASLRDCMLSPIGMHQCSASNDLILDCGFPDPIHTQMRLVGGGGKVGAGRLEMRPSAAHEWGTVSDVWGANMLAFNWQIYNAFAVCWSLGFLNVTNPILTTAFGPGLSTQTIWWSLVQCSASDTVFHRCRSNYPFGYSLNFGHNNDLGVDCFPPPFEPIFKLEAGGAPWRGRIMMQYTPFVALGSVCNDLLKFNHFAWNAACRSAGFLNVTQAKYMSFGPALASAPINVDDYVCAPTDRFLQNCTHALYGQHNCHHGEDAGVDCYPPPEDTTVWQFRLAGGTAATNGRLEMRPGSTFGWGSVCAGPYFNHTVAAWEAACRQVGIMNPPRARWRYFPKGSDTVYLDNVSCNAGDLFLVPNCTMFPLGSFRCDPSEVAGVDCNAPAEVPSQWQFRLTGGRSNTSGRVEMRPDPATRFGVVCRRGLTTFEALRAVCRSAGFPTATRPVVYRPLTPPPSTLPFYLDKAVCNASTPYLHNCSFAPLYSHDCSIELGDALYVDCFPTATPVQTLSETLSLASSQSISRAPTPSAVPPPSPTAPRTASQPITPTHDAALTATTTGSRVGTTTLRKPPTRTRTDIQTVTGLHTKTHSATSTKTKPSPSQAPTTTQPPVMTATLTHGQDGPSTSATAPRTFATPSPSLIPTPTARKTASPPPMAAAPTAPQSHSASQTRTAPTEGVAPSHTASGPAASDSLRHERTNSVTMHLPPCDADRSALDTIWGTSLLRPLGTAYLAWPPATTSVPFSVPLSAAAAVGHNFLPVLDPSTDFTTTARLVDPATLQPLRLGSVGSSPSTPSASFSAVAVAVRRFLNTPMHLNATISVGGHDLSAAPALLAPGSVVLVGIPTADLLRCVGGSGMANMTIVARVVLVDATLFGGGAAGGGDGPLPPPTPVREVEPPVEYQSAAAADEVAAMFLACEGRVDGLTSMAFFRMLSPFATGSAHAMVLAGSAVVTGLVLAGQVLTVVWMRARGKAKSLLACAAAARAPAITIAVAEPLWFGVAYAGASLVVGAATNPLQIVAGAATCASTVAIPVLVVLGLRRYASRRLIAYKRVFPHPVPACLAPHIAPTTRVKPEVLVKVLAPLVSFRSLHPLFPASGSLSPAITALVVLLTGAIPGLCRLSHALIAIAHILLAVGMMAVSPRRTTLLNAFAATHHLSIAAVFGGAALMMAIPAESISASRAEAVLYTLIVIQTGFVGCRIALTPLAFFSDRLLPYKGVRAIAEYIAPVAESKDPLEFMPGHPDYFRDDEDRRLHNVDDDPILSSDSQGDDSERERVGGFLSFIPFFSDQKEDGLVQPSRQNCQRKPVRGEGEEEEDKGVLLVADALTTATAAVEAASDEDEDYGDTLPVQSSHPPPHSSRVSLLQQKTHSTVSIPLASGLYSGEAAVSLSSEEQVDADDSGCGSEDDHHQQQRQILKTYSSHDTSEAATERSGSEEDLFGDI